MEHINGALFRSVSPPLPKNKLTSCKHRVRNDKDSQNETTMK